MFYYYYYNKILLLSCSSFFFFFLFASVDANIINFQLGPRARLVASNANLLAVEILLPRYQVR